VYDIKILRGFGMESFTTFEIEKKLGIPRNRLQQWIDRGFVTPSIEQASGHGTKNRFSRNDLYRMELFKRLAWYGLSRKEASEYSDISFENVGQSKYLVVKREVPDENAICMIGTMEIVSSPPEIDFNGDVLVFVVNLLLIQEKVDRKLA